MPDTCSHGGKYVEEYYGHTVTAVGYSSPAGHNHDDNCRVYGFKCDKGEWHQLSPINKCHKCDWKGKQTCFCSEKVEELPEL